MEASIQQPLKVSSPAQLLSAVLLNNSVSSATKAPLLCPPRSTVLTTSTNSDNSQALNMNLWS